MASAFPPKRILVVDDNRDAADITVALLQMHGHIALAVYGGSDCIQRAVDLLPDIILLDLSMPVVDGFEVAASLSQFPQLRDVVLVHRPFHAPVQGRAQGAYRWAVYQGGLSLVEKSSRFYYYLAPVTFRHENPPAAVHRALQRPAFFC